jgi:hypothetical protein
MLIIISISVDNKKNQTIEVLAKDIQKVADFLKEKETTEKPPIASTNLI